MTLHKKTPRLIIISSPSGGGKSTICNMIIKRSPDIEYSISTTTRPPRQHEEDGKEYFFVAKDEFEKMIKNDAFLEWAMVHGNYYGTSRKKIEDLLNRGKSCILDIDVQGGMQIKNKHPNAVSVFIMPPSFEELEKRLKERSTDNEESIKLRLDNAKKEMEYKKFYDYVVVNNKIEDTINKIVEILN